MSIKTVFQYFIFFISIHLFAQEEHLLRLLPSSEELQGFEMTDEPEYFQGDDLFFLINGGADIYLEYGFKDVISVSFKDELDLRFKVEIYQMLNDSAAYGIFSFNRNDREIFHDIGDESIRREDYVIFIKGLYYVVLTTQNNQEGKKVNLQGKAKLIAAKIKGSGAVPLLVSEYDSLAPSAIYLRGNLALSNIYLFDYSDVFQFMEGIYFQKSGISAFIFQYPSAEAVEKVFGNLKIRFQSSTRFHNFTENETGFQVIDKKEQLISFTPQGDRMYIFIGNDSTDMEKHKQSLLQ